MDVLLEIGLVVVFVLVGGFFAAAEIALVTLRGGQVRALAERGGRGRRVAKLRDDSNRFLSAVQIGVTFAGFFAASYGGATIAARLEPVLAGWGLPLAVAATLALLLITALVSYVSLVIGELVPKRLALQRPETVALATAGVLDRLATVTRPVIWLLSRSTDAVVRLLGIDPRTRAEEVSEEELRDMVATSDSLSATERRLIGDAFTATDRTLREVMIPRTEVDFLGAELTVDEAVAAVARHPHSRYPVVGASVDDAVGVLHVRDLLTARYAATATASDRSEGAGVLRDLVRPLAALPGSRPVVEALEEMRRGGRHIVLVIDEYGGTDGIVTIEDLVEEIVGEIRDEDDPSAAPTRTLPDGGFAVDGLLHRVDLTEDTGVALPGGPSDTVGGFVLDRLGRVPEVGDTVDAAGHRFRVEQIDGRRVARVHVTPHPAAPAPDGI